MRWLLGTFGEEKEVYLIAQALPCSMAMIEANAALKSDHTRGIMLGKFPVNYDSFDDDLASGKIQCRYSLRYLLVNITVQIHCKIDVLI